MQELLLICLIWKVLHLLTDVWHFICYKMFKLQKMIALFPLSHIFNLSRMFLKITDLLNQAAIRCSHSFLHGNLFIVWITKHDKINCCQIHIKIILWCYRSSEQGQTINHNTYWISWKHFLKIKSTQLIPWLLKIGTRHFVFGALSLLLRLNMSSCLLHDVTKVLLIYLIGSFSRLHLEMLSFCRPFMSPIPSGSLHSFPLPWEKLSSLMPVHNFRLKWITI